MSFCLDTQGLSSYTLSLKKQVLIIWIIETKGRVWEGTRATDEAIGSWCRRVSEQTGEQWRYIRINQKDVNLVKSVSLSALVDGLHRQAPTIFKVEE